MNRFQRPSQAGGRRGRGRRARPRAAALALRRADRRGRRRRLRRPGRPPARVPPASGTAARHASAGRARAAPAASAAAAATCDPEASSLAPLPGPPQVTPGSFMAKIKARGYLIAGVDQNTYHFELLQPARRADFEGFDIDMIRAVAQAIFGNPNKVQYKAITDAERITDIINGSVDIVAHTMTITCDRLKQVDFSSVYFDAHQRVLVLDGSTATGLADLGGQKVCATKGSDSVSTIEDNPTHPKVVQVPYMDRLPRPAAAGPGGGDLHRRLDPGRARGAGPVHQDRGPRPDRRALRPGDLQGSTRTSSASSTRSSPSERARRRLGGQLPPLGRQPGRRQPPPAGYAS